MQDKSLLILGRQPALGLAELESLFGAGKLRPAGTEAAVLSVDPSLVDFSRLGGSIKICRIITTLGSTRWPEVQRELEQLVPRLIAGAPDGKIQLGLSAYRLEVKPRQLLAAGLTLKKILRADGRSVRLVPNQTAALNSAQVLHNQLTGENGRELVLVRDGGRTIIAQTTAEQDIASYTLRDRERPKRDARVGMLPPKLAQIIINLAVGQKQPSNSFAILDPFCGTGVVLQEAMLMDFSAMGSDIDPRMADYTGANLDWLWHMFPQTEAVDRSWQLGDATSLKWETSKFIKENGEVINAVRVPAQIDAVASEAYLGQPFGSFPSREKLEQVRGTCNAIIEKFLTNIGQQIKPRTRLCLAVPAWQEKSEQFIHLPLLDHLENLGYNRVRFEHVRDEQLLYYREDQIVARELLVLTRK